MKMQEAVAPDLFISSVEILSIISAGSVKANISMSDALTSALQTMNKLSLPKTYPEIVSALKNDQLLQMVTAYEAYKAALNKLGNEALRYDLQPKNLKKYEDPIDEIRGGIRADYMTCVARAFKYVEIK